MQTEYMHANMDSIKELLNQFKGGDDRLLRLAIIILPYLPILLAFLLLLDWWIGPGHFARDIFPLTAVITFIIELIIFNVLFNKVSKALDIIWKRGIIDPSNEVQTNFKGFIQNFQAHFNSHEAHFVGITFAIGGIINTYPILYLYKGGNLPTDWISFYLVKGGIFEILFAYIFGLFFWRLGAIAFFVYQLGDKFKLKIQPYHNDKSGGLKPIGDLCLTIAIIILLPVFLLSGWIVVGTLPQYKTIDILWADWFKFLLLGLSLVAAFFFFLPLYRIHKQMKEKRQEIQFKLDKLDSKIDEILTKLNTEAYTIEPSEGGKLFEKLEFMEKIYYKSNSVPTWPFDWSIIIKFIAAEAVPILSLIGVSEQLVKVILPLFSQLS